MDYRYYYGIAKNELFDFLKLVLKYIKQLEDILFNKFSLETLIEKYFTIANTYNPIKIQINKNYISHYLSTVTDDNEKFLMVKWQTHNVLVSL